jgi:hypothetical protein
MKSRIKIIKVNKIQDLHKIFQMMKTSILEYYSLAESYDENRFGNSYGKYIDQQERAF